MRRGGRFGRPFCTRDSARGVRGGGHHTPVSGPLRSPGVHVHETLLRQSSHLPGETPLHREKASAALGSARPVLRRLGLRTSAFLSPTSLTPQRGVTQSFASGGLPVSLSPLKLWKLSPALPEPLTYSSFPSPHTRGVGCRPPSKAHSRALGHYYDLIINYYSLVGGGVSSTAQGAPERDRYMSLL